MLVPHSSLRCRIVPSCTLSCTSLWISLFQLAPSCGSLADSCRSGELNSVSKSMIVQYGRSTCCALQLQRPARRMFPVAECTLAEYTTRTSPTPVACCPRVWSCSELSRSTLRDVLLVFPRCVVIVVRTLHLCASTPLHFCIPRYAVDHILQSELLLALSDCRVLHSALRCRSHSAPLPAALPSVFRYTVTL